MHLERVVTLIKYMERLPKKAAEHFDMGSWFAAPDRRMKANGFIKGKDDILKCGTSACALGWAGTVPAFQKAGLQVLAVNCDIKEASPGGLTNSIRANAFFEIDDDEFEILFGPDNRDESPKDWAARIREYLAGEGYTVPA